MLKYLNIFVFELHSGDRYTIPRLNIQICAYQITELFFKMICDLSERPDHFYIDVCTCRFGYFNNNYG